MSPSPMNPIVSFMRVMVAGELGSWVARWLRSWGSFDPATQLPSYPSTIPYAYSSGPGHSEAGDAGGVRACAGAQRARVGGARPGLPALRRLPAGGRSDAVGVVRGLRRAGGARRAPGVAALSRVQR